MFNKASPVEDISIKILKNSIHIYLEKPTKIFNECLINGKFPDTLERADVTPIFKKGNDNEKENYRSVSMLSTFTKVFEKLLFEQINDHMQSKFSKHLTGFHKYHSTQIALLVMIEKWKTILKKKANLKLHALKTISRFLSPERHVLIISAYIKSLLNYCRLVWIFCYWGIMHKMNKIHERSLHLLLKNYSDDFQDHLRSSDDISIHQRCINSLITEVCKYIHGLSP